MHSAFNKAIDDGATSRVHMHTHRTWRTTRCLNTKWNTMPADRRTAHLAAKHSSKPSRLNGLARALRFTWLRTAPNARPALCVKCSEYIMNAHRAPGRSGGEQIPPQCAAHVQHNATVQKRGGNDHSAHKVQANDHRCLKAQRHVHVRRQNVDSTCQDADSMGGPRQNDQSNDTHRATTIARANVNEAGHRLSRTHANTCRHQHAKKTHRDGQCMHTSTLYMHRGEAMTRKRASANGGGDKQWNEELESFEEKRFKRVRCK